MGRGILGGSFNPVHVGHLRLAIEVREALGGLVDGIDLVPAGNPPHKQAESLLPFALRAAMLEAAIAPYPFLACNRMEELASGPSYTWDTLLAYGQRLPGQELYFIMGSADFALLPTWHRGLELPGLCHFVVVPRGGMDVHAFADMVCAIWPAASPHAPVLSEGACMALPGGRLAHYLPLPWLAVSASRIRQRLLAGKNIDWLMPEAALELLHSHAKDIDCHWKENA